MFQGIIQWWKYDQKDRSDHLKNMVSKINLEQVPMEKLLSCRRDTSLTDTELLSKINDTINLILALRYDHGDIKPLWEMRHNKTLWKDRYCMEQEVMCKLSVF